MIPHIGPWEMGLVLAVIMIIFGVGKLPQVGGALGKGLRAFRKGQSGEYEEKEEEEEPPKPKRKAVKKKTKTKKKKTAS
jgi:sec-independent protein translocase protein TatA